MVETNKHIGLILQMKRLKELYPHNFEWALKSMTCVQIESIKNQNGALLPWQPTKIPVKGQKISSRRPKYLKLEKQRNTKFLTCYCDIMKQCLKWSIFFIVHLKIHNGGFEWEQRFFIRFFSCFQKFLQFGRNLFHLNHSFNSSKELLKISSEQLERFLRYFGRRVKKCYSEKKTKKGGKVTQLQIIKTTSD